jgi:hypothetical protein
MNLTLVTPWPLRLIARIAIARLPPPSVQDQEEPTLVIQSEAGGGLGLATGLLLLGLRPVNRCVRDAPGRSRGRRGDRGQIHEPGQRSAEQPGALPESGARRRCDGRV